jgi:hypothetical protein
MLLWLKSAAEILSPDRELVTEAASVYSEFASTPAGSIRTCGVAEVTGWKTGLAIVHEASDGFGSASNWLLCE